MLILQGDLDRAVPVHAARSLSALLTDVTDTTYVELEKCGHQPMVSRQTRQFRNGKLVLGFLLLKVALTTFSYLLGGRVRRDLQLSLLEMSNRSNDRRMIACFQCSARSLCVVAFA